MDHDWPGSRPLNHHLLYISTVGETIDQSEFCRLDKKMWMSYVARYLTGKVQKHKKHQLHQATENPQP